MSYSKIAAKLVDDLPEVNDGTNGVTWDNPLTGKTAETGDISGIQIYAKDKSSQRAYLNGDYGNEYGGLEYKDYMMGLVGNDESQYTKFMDFIFNPKTKEEKDLARSLAGTIEMETVTFGQGNSYKQDRDRPDSDEDSPKYYLKLLYELFKGGIEVN